MTPPGPIALARELSQKRQIVEGVLEHLIREGRLIRLPGGLIVGAGAIEQLAEQVRRGPSSFDIAGFKERFELSRKWAIPLLEHLDAIGVTRREGDRRHVVE
ncbi:MAG: SelB C-terminal domain-containing protein [Acidobacteriota bacterium]